MDSVYKRIQVIHCVAKAYKRFCDQHGDIVCKSFLDVGLSLPPDGSQDHLSIKDFEHGNPIIGDFAQTDEEIEAYQRAHIKIPEIGENGEYILEDGKPLRQYALLSNAQLRAALRARGIPGIAVDRQKREDDQVSDGRRFHPPAWVLRVRF